MTTESLAPPTRLTRLPITAHLRPAVIASLVIAALAAAGALAGILAPDSVYPTAELLQNSLPNDIVTLVLVIPVLLIALFLAMQGKLIGLLLWPAALLTIVYNALVYALGLPVGWPMVLNLLLVAIAIYTTLGLLAGIDRDATRQALDGRLPLRLAGGVLIAFGALFFLIAVGTIAGAVVQGAPLPDRALMTTDMLIAPFWFISGLLLWRGTSSGYVLGPVALFLAGLLFVGLLLVLLLQPVVTDASLGLVDVAVIGLASLIVLIPLFLVGRGIVSATSS